MYPCVCFAHACVLCCFFQLLYRFPNLMTIMKSLSDKCLLFSCCYLASYFDGISFINSQPTSVCRGVCMFVCACVNQIVCLSVRRLTHIGHGNNPTAPTSLFLAFLRQEIRFDVMTHKKISTNKKIQFD